MYSRFANYFTLQSYFMKAFILVFLTSLSFFNFKANAQLTIANGGFENWVNIGGSDEEPTGWNSNKTGTGNAATGPQTAFRESSNPHGGTYSARVKSGSVFGIVVNGSLTTGRVEAPSFNKNEGFIRTLPSDPNFNMPFSGRPDSLVFWLRYTPGGSDRVRLEARLHVGTAYAPEAPVNGNHPDSSQNIIARATFLSDNAALSNWTRFSLPFVYVDGRTPQFILITSTPSHDQAGGNSNSTMWLDDISVIYNPVLGSVNTGTFYASANDGANINIPVTAVINYNFGNVFTAQLSDASGSFINPTNIGTLNSVGSGIINATIPAGTLTGSGYRVRVVASNPGAISKDNGQNINIVLVNNSITPSTSQNILASVNGTMLTINETPSGSSREWKFSTISGTGYQSFSPAETGTTYTPNFSANGNFYVVAESQIQGLSVISNEVLISVNSITLTSGSLSTTLFEMSASAPSGLVDVPFTTSGNFNVGNIFTAELSDANGSFVSPTIIGTLADISSGVINAEIPNTLPTGSNYKVRVVSDNPIIIGSESTDLISIDQFQNTVTPADSQTIIVPNLGDALTVNESQQASHEWKVSTISGSAYQSFNPIETGATYVPDFDTSGQYFVVAASVNQFNDEVISNEVKINVFVVVGVHDNLKTTVKAWNYHHTLTVDLRGSDLKNPQLYLSDMQGKIVLSTPLNSGEINLTNHNFSSGIYLLKINDVNQSLSLKLPIGF